MFGKAKRVFPPLAVENGREQSHDSHATENEQYLHQGVSGKANKKIIKGYTLRLIRAH